MRPGRGDGRGGSSLPDTLIWRGAEPTLSGHRSETADNVGRLCEDALTDEEPLRRRLGPRVMSGFGAIGFVLAVTIVSGSWSDGDAPAAGPISNRAEDNSGRNAQEPTGPTDSAEPLVTDRPDVDLGLSYGGAGGGADVRDMPPVSSLSAVPMVDPDVLLRIPESIDTVVWSVTVPAAELKLGGTDLAIDVTVVDEVVAVSAVTRVAVAGSSIESSGHDGRAVVLLNVADGSAVSEALAVPAEVKLLEESADAQVARRAVARTFISPGALAARTISSSAIADELTRRAIEQLDAGEASVLAADEVAQGRAVAFIGDRLVGLRAAPDDGVTSADGSPLIADWTRVGVLVGVAASDRGALLLVSDRRGRQQMTIDAATGETVVELSFPAGSDFYVPAANGVVVRRPAAIGSLIEAVDLDGRSMWQLIGPPAWTLGDGLIVTASYNSSGLTIEARR